MKTKSYLGVIIFAAIFAFMFLLCVFFPGEGYSNAERRPLAEIPAISTETVFDGSFSRDFETYASERIPLRDVWHKIKASFAFKILKHKDNNGLYVSDGHISKIDTPENDYMTDYATDKFREIYNTYMINRNNKVYLSVVPDKNMFLSTKNGYPYIDYDKFISKIKDKTVYMEYIDIIPFLELDDYYRTDTHWRQEKIKDISYHIASSMGVSVSDNYTVNTLGVPFKGVYHGQLAMEYEPDTIKYLTNDTIDNCEVTYYDTGSPRKGDMYSIEKAQGKDPYEMFLNGSMPLVTIENLQNTSGKELIMLRDSFGSSLAPLLCEGYSKITLVDIRYINSKVLGNFIDFNNSDILFIYSTAILNNSTALK